MTTVSRPRTYPRALVWDIARVLRDLRAHVPVSHLSTLDFITRAIGELVHEHDDTVDLDRFYSIAQIGRDTPTRKE